MAENDTDTDAGATRSGFSRRTALKSVGVGAAVAWVAPTILTTAPAYAAAGSVACEPAAGGNCSGTFNCGAGCTTGTSTGNIGCFGVTDTEGKCFCAQGVTGCAALTVACTSSSDCGGRQRCIVQSCCGGNTGYCYDPCGVNCH